MLGIGEKEEEIKEVLQDMQEAGVDILTIGQYLQPSKQHAGIDRWVTPDEFKRWKEYALEIGFGACESGPMIRSSYHADEQSDMFDVRARRRAMLAEQSAAKEAATMTA